MDSSAVAETGAANCGVHPQISKALHKILQNPCAHQLTLRRTRSLTALDALSVQHIFQVLNETPRITHLRIMSCAVPTGAWRTLCHSLQHAKYLRSLELWGGCGEDDDEADASLLECCAVAAANGELTIEKIKLGRFDFCSSFQSHCALSKLLQARPGEWLRALEFEECTFCADHSNALCQGLALQENLAEFSLCLSQLDDSTAAEMLQALGFNLRSLNLSRCFLGPRAYRALNRFLSRPEQRLEILVLTEEKMINDASWRENAKAKFARVLHGNDSLQHLHLTTCGTGEPRLQLLTLRNRTTAQVRQSLKKQQSSLNGDSLALWGRGLATLARCEKTVGLSGLYLALSTLSPELATTTTHKNKNAVVRRKKPPHTRTPTARKPPPSAASH